MVEMSILNFRANANDDRLNLSLYIGTTPKFTLYKWVYNFIDSHDVSATTRDANTDYSINIGKTTYTISSNVKFMHHKKSINEDPKEKYKVPVGSEFAAFTQTNIPIILANEGIEEVLVYFRIRTDNNSSPAE
ncbi:hypothetical protein HK099_000210 [Clydaea vesicula]|uniref:Uncharacterized protein n=1 Tax=Clydaea vesicula TaxID=447962 RepID=A0AAD5TVK2_9FUNG|nr:hypothetical protein HK099_000210 [Clydaea vesicula]